MTLNISEGFSNFGWIISFLRKPFSWANKFDPFQVKYSVTEMMQEWTMQLGYPLVTISVEYDDNQYRTSMSQMHFLTNKNYSQSIAQVNGVWWHLKIEFISSRGTEDFTWLLNEPHNYVISEQSRKTDVTSTNEKFLLVNWRCEHFYRVNYDNATWSRIISALKKNASALDSAAKACLIDNAWSLLAADLLSAEVPLNLTVIALKNDSSYPLWKTVKHHLKRAYSLMYLSQDRDKFQEYCWKIVDLAMTTSNESGSGDFDLMRQEYLLDFANFVEHQSTVQNSIEKVVRWLDNPRKYRPQLCETSRKRLQMALTVKPNYLSGGIPRFDISCALKNVHHKFSKKTHNAQIGVLGDLALVLSHRK